MATEKQIIANRQNAQSSTGPRTEAGLRISSMNAYRHGLTGHIAVHPPDEAEAYDKFCASIVASLAPAEGIEREFAQAIAEDQWRLNRARTLENNMFTLASFRISDDDSESPEIDRARADVHTFIAAPERFNLLTSYERRIHSNMTKSLKQLTELQSVRRAAEKEAEEKRNALREQALEEARLLVQLDESEGVPCDPAGEFTHPNGFVFPNAEIVRTIRHLARLRAARQAEPAAATPSLRRAA
jgi:hypothetical protein